MHPDGREVKIDTTQTEGKMYSTIIIIIIIVTADLQVTNEIRILIFLYEPYCY